MTKIFVKRGDQIHIAEANTDPVLDHIPAAVYSINMTREGNIFLEKIRDKFTVPAKIYGRLEKYTEVLTGDFAKECRAAGKTTGVLLTGDKGSGKSLLCEKVANKILASGVPVIVIESVLPAFTIRQTIRAVGPCVVIFDEFEKMYPMMHDTRPDQSELLTIFSDSSLKGVMFMLTANDPSYVSPFIIHRSGRVKRWIRFKTPDFQDFLEVAEGVHIEEEILNYLSFYFEIAKMGIQYGTDTLLQCLELGRSSKTLEEFVEMASYSNIPNPFKIGVSFTTATLVSDPEVVREMRLKKMRFADMIPYKPVFDIYDGDSDAVIDRITLNLLALRASGSVATGTYTSEKGDVYEMVATFSTILSQKYVLTNTASQKDILMICESSVINGKKEEPKVSETDGVWSLDSKESSNQGLYPSSVGRDQYTPVMYRPGF